MGATEKLVSFIGKLLTSTKIRYNAMIARYFLSISICLNPLLLNLIIAAQVYEIFERKRCRISFPRLCTAEPRKNPV